MSRHARANRLVIKVDHDGRITVNACPDCTGPVEVLDLVEEVEDKLYPLANVPEVRGSADV